MDQTNKRLSAMAMRRKMNVGKFKKANKNISLKSIKKSKTKMAQANGASRNPLKKRLRRAPAKNPESDAEISDEVEIIEEGILLPRRIRKKSERSENQKYDADRSSEDDDSVMLVTKDDRKGKKSDFKVKSIKKASKKFATSNKLDVDDDAIMKNSDSISSDEEDESDISSENDDEETSDSKSESEELNDVDSKSKQINSGHSKKNKVACGNEAAEATFRWLIQPFSPDTFFTSILDKKHLYVKRNNTNYYQGLFNCNDVDKILRENDMEYQRHIDVLSYVNGKRIPIETDTKVYAGVVWNAYNEGNSIRLRNPQSYHKGLWKLCSLLQEYFSSPVGVNMYLTPAGSQGFPPHYDDIDAFILQIEGVKQWKVYTPRSPNEVLPRFPSVDFKEGELHAPYFQVSLKPGDLLYLPRGFIHQARTPKDAHSLHLTFSTNQLNTWGDFIREGLNSALDIAMAQDVAFRESLPKDYFDFVGTAFANLESKKKDWFIKKTLSLAEKAIGYFPVEEAADFHAVEFIHKSMPPVLNKLETSCSIHGDGGCVDGKAVLARKLTPYTKVRLIRKRAFRLVVGDESAQLFYTLSNSLDQLEKEKLFLEVDLTEVPAACHLLQKCPEFVEVDKLPHDDTEARLNFAQQLYDVGFLMVEPSS